MGRINLEIRLVTEDDAIDFWNIRLRALSEEPSAFAASYEEEVSKPIDDIINRIREQWSLPENYIVGAFKDGLLVGIVGFVREHRKNLSHKGNIWGMYVLPEARRQGIGKLLLIEVVRRSHNLGGLEQIVLTVTSNNKSAKGLYENIGFRYYGVEKRALKVGLEYFDDEFMVLPIMNK
jgi:ribosomal protein S18 acetylase RimI-like enzyme